MAVQLPAPEAEANHDAGLESSPIDFATAKYTDNAIHPIRQRIWTTPQPPAIIPHT
jgi:hypothetical protein